ncbi:MAG: pyridoxal 5'-phosphate synthase glutaminase subunit PdxT [Prevotella sp.]|nr:pyridoxal 5'-phosphate synthase glutaminase subunit PdxT [Prevotella sp.]
MTIAVLALQGAFAEHQQMLQRLGVDTFQVRQLADWQQHKDALVLPGGESTVQMRLLHNLGLYEPIREAILDGLPVVGTCAGMILLSQGYLNTMSVRVLRNAYGRQLGSFHTVGSVAGMGSDIPMTFIRAPYVQQVLSPDVEILAQVDSRVVAVRQGRQFATAFHPELDDDLRFYFHFLASVTNAAGEQ